MLYTQIKRKHRFVRGFAGFTRCRVRWDNYARWEVIAHQFAHRAAESVCSSYVRYASCMTQLDAQTLAKSTMMYKNIVEEGCRAALRESFRQSFQSKA